MSDEREDEIDVEIRRHARTNALGNLPVRTHQRGCSIAVDDSTCSCTPTWDTVDGRPPTGTA